MRTLISLILCVMCVYSACGAKPNIVFIVGDDMGWNDVGYHNSDMYTPTLDALAKGGVTLDNYYVTPMCSPSRAAFMTGRYPIRYGLQHDVINPSQAVGLPLNETILPQKMKEAGYKTHIVGKWHLGFYKWEHTPTYRYFDTFMGYYNWGEDYYKHNVTDNCASCAGFDGIDLRNGTSPMNATNDYSSYFFTDETERIISHHNPSSPLFLYLPYQACHDPIEAPPSQFYMDKCSHIQNKTRQEFCAMAGLLDEAVLNVTRALIRANLWNNTILIFTTDNGGDPMLVAGGGNNWPLRGAKRTNWEGGIRAIGFVNSPLLPSTSKGTTSTGLMHAVDWLPTLSTLVGVDPESEGFPLDGVDVWDTIVKNAPSPRTEFLVNYDSIYGNGALRFENYKLLVGPQLYNDWYPVPNSNWEDMQYFFGLGPNPVVPNITLFDVVADPTEHNDIADENPDIVAKLLVRLQTYVQTSVAPNFPSPDPRADPSNFKGYWTPWA